MTALEVSALVRSFGGDIWNVTPEKGSIVLYAEINRTHCRIIVLRPGQSPLTVSNTPTFLTHVATESNSLKEWLFGLIQHTSTRQDVPTSHAV